MTDPGREAADLVEDRPEFEEDLRQLLAVDEGRETWTFGDVPLDSGHFGEVVSRGIVVDADGGDGYRVADPDAVRAAIDGHGAGGGHGTGNGADATGGDPDGVGSPGSRAVPSPGQALPVGGLRRRVESSLSDLDRVTAGSILGAFALLVAFRLVPYGSVFRDGAVVLPGNDPYYYRYWVERVGARAGGPLDLAVLGSLPEAVRTGEPLTVAALWWVAELVGTGTDAGVVLAWYPVAAGLVVGGLVYALAVELAADRRVAVAAVAALATVPVHALRTSVGVADHHAFDLPWLAVTALALVVAVDPDRRGRSTWLGVGALALGAGVAGQTLAWEAAPVLLVPVGLFVGAHALSARRADGVDPVGAGIEVVAGLGIGAIVVVLVHLGLGWHDPIVVAVPALLCGGAAGLYGLAGVADRQGIGVRTLAGGEAVALLAGAVLFPVVAPSLAGEFAGRAGALLSNPGVGETLSLFGGARGPVLGPLFRLGLVGALALPHLAWFTWRAGTGHAPTRLVVVVYAWYLTLLAAVQARFASGLSVFLAVLAGVGVVHLAAWLGAARPPVPFDPDSRDTDGQADRPGGRESEGPGERATAPDDPAPPVRSVAWPGRQGIQVVLVVGLLVVGTGAVGTVSEVRAIEIGDGQYRTATAADRYAESHGLTGAGSYVLSEWSWNRMYNYFVGGEARSYAFARENYGDVLAGAPGPVYERHADRVGFLVVGEFPEFDAREGSLYARHRPLFDGGSGTLPALGHYRVIRVDRTAGLLLVRLVPGATIEGQAAPNATVTASTGVTVGGETFAYRRTVETAADGSYSVRVAYPGTYRADGRSVRVTASDVENGTTVAADGNADPRPRPPGSLP